MAHAEIQPEEPGVEVLTPHAGKHWFWLWGNHAPSMIDGRALLFDDNGKMLGHLENFRAGRRGYAEQDQAGQRMRALAASLSDAQITSLAQHYAGLQLVKQPLPESAAAKAGAARYQATCAACHGQFAQGYPQQQSPNLRILSGWYIDQQLLAFVQGWRGADQHADIRSKWMRAVATQITDDAERQAVVDYIGSLGAGS